MPNPTPSPYFQIGGVDCAIYLGEDGEEGGIVETWTDKGLEISIDFIVAWEDRIRFLQGLRGSATWDGDSPGKVTRELPFTLPMNDRDTFPASTFPDNTPYVWARYVCYGTSAFQPRKVRVDQDGSVTGMRGWAYYDDVVIQAHFSSPSYFILDQQVPYTMGYDLSGFPYTTTTTRTTGEIFAPYTNSYKFSTPPNQPMNEANVAILRPKTEITVTRHYMPMIDTETYEKLIGRVNKEPITLGTHTYPEESILYNSYEVDPYGDVSTGTTYYDIKHQWIANGTVLDTNGKDVSSWNYFIRPDNGLWDKLEAVKGGQRPYQSAEFLPAIWPDFHS